MVCQEPFLYLFQLRTHFFPFGGSQCGICKEGLLLLRKFSRRPRYIKKPPNSHPTEPTGPLWKPQQTGSAVERDSEPVQRHAREGPPPPSRFPCAPRGPTSGRQAAAAPVRCEPAPRRDLPSDRLLPPPPAPHGFAMSLELITLLGGALSLLIVAIYRIVKNLRKVSSTSGSESVAYKPCILSVRPSVSVLVDGSGESRETWTAEWKITQLVQPWDDTVVHIIPGMFPTLAPSHGGAHVSDWPSGPGALAGGGRGRRLHEIAQQAVASILRPAPPAPVWTPSGARAGRAAGAGGRGRCGAGRGGDCARGQTRSGDSGRSGIAQLWLDTHLKAGTWSCVEHSARFNTLYCASDGFPVHFHHASNSHPTLVPLVSPGCNAVPLASDEIPLSPDSLLPYVAPAGEKDGARVHVRQRDQETDVMREARVRVTVGKKIDDGPNDEAVPVIHLQRLFSAAEMKLPQVRPCSPRCVASEERWGMTRGLPWRLVMASGRPDKNQTLALLPQIDRRHRGQPKGHSGSSTFSTQCPPKTHKHHSWNLALCDVGSQVLGCVLRRSWRRSSGGVSLKGEFAASCPSTLANSVRRFSSCEADAPVKGSRRLLQTLPKTGIRLPSCFPSVKLPFLRHKEFADSFLGGRHFKRLRINVKIPLEFKLTSKVTRYIATPN
ncbi:Protein of unknown function [Gryllus bimaculatus]|nr:Protein of unknown function [Gryllus bimaculatus]